MKDYCTDATIKKPVTFILIFTALSLLEYFVLIWALKNPDEELLNIPLGKRFYIKYTRWDVASNYAVVKYLFIALALFYIIMGVNIYA